jgi:hypothetical protein
LSFFASNNRIHITNAAGETVFDTDKPMPHVIQRIQKSISVTFPNIPSSWRNVMIPIGPTPMCRRREFQWVCRQEWVCRTEQQCTLKMVNGVLQQVCEPVQRCGYEQVCGNEWVDIDGDGYQYHSKYTYSPVEWSQVVEIGPVVDGLDADFLLVNAVAARTAQGALFDTGPVPCGLPLGQTFVANNSSIIETASDVANGQPWMTRIMSIYVENGIIKAQFKHSNRGFEARSKWDGGLYCEGMSDTPPIAPGAPGSSPSVASAYNFNLDIVVGKFTI